MDWNLDKGRPICPQIYEQLSALIACGNIKPGERLLSVREVALEAGVNPNTVQKSFEQLESAGIIYSVRGSGWFVGDDIQTAKKSVSDMAHKRTSEYFGSMKNLGFDADAVKNYVREWNQ